MNPSPTEEFQKKVGKLLVRNSNILDILTKCQISCAKMCRSGVRSATGCGCVTISGKKNLDTLKISSGTSGTLCPQCRSTIENEIGENLFYIASLCNALDLSMAEIMKHEIKNVETLGKYSLR
jgi:hypothetical protein